MFKKLTSQSGAFLIVVLWILVILSLLTIGIGRRSRVELALAKHSVGKIRSKTSVLAGLVYAINLIAQDAQDEDGSLVDTKFACGFSLNEGESKEALFKQIDVGGGYFDIGYFVEQDGAEKQIQYGFSDEDGKININAINRRNYQILLQLFIQLDMSRSDAAFMTSAIVDWRDSDDMVFLESAKKESETYHQKNVALKNATFDSLYELLLIDGMDEDLFIKCKPYLTVFPKKGNLKFNLNTVSLPVLKAVVRNFTGKQSNSTVGDGDSLAEKLVSERRGADGYEGTEDDQLINMVKMSLNAKERTLALMMKGVLSESSRFINVFIKGFDQSSQAITFLNVIIDRRAMEVVYWRRR